jgi:hypothetical protein
MGRVTPLLLLLLAAVGLGLRLVGAAELPWASGEASVPETLRSWIGPSPLAARAIALAIGAATAPLAFLLLRPLGRAPAFAAAQLVALSPWHVHASRVGGPATSAFLALLVAGACASSLLRRTRDWTPRLALAVAAAAAAILLLARSEPAAVRAGPLALLAGDVGVALPLLALAAFARRERRGEHALALLACAACAAIATRLGARVEPAAWLLPPLLLAAADELGRWLAAAPDGRARVAVAALAIVPTLPSLLSEPIDGGRHDVAALQPAFAAARRAGEPLFASDPALVERVFGVEARPLHELGRAAPGELGGAAPAGGRAEFVVLLLERGEIVGGAPGVAELQAGMDLIARSGRKRLDLARHEARLYRREAPR